MEIVTSRADLSSAPAQELVDRLNSELSEGYPEEGANFLTLDPSEITPGRGLFVLAWLDGVAIGCGAVKRLGGADAEIKCMYVKPTARGRGVGGAILAELEAEALALGARRIVLETGLRQPEAVALYRRHSYDVIPNFGPYVDSPLSLCMAKTLAHDGEHA